MAFGHASRDDLLPLPRANPFKVGRPRVDGVGARCVCAGFAGVVATLAQGSSTRSTCTRERFRLRAMLPESVDVALFGGACDHSTRTVNE